ncbi:MAG: S8 family serine peptidase [Pseudomonadota bacterium]
MRLIVANRLSGGRSRREKREAVDRVAGTLSANTNILRDSKPAAEEKRRVLVVEADTADVARLADELGGDVLIEPEMPRYSAESVCLAVDAIVEAQGSLPPSAGLGQKLEFRVLGDGKGIVGARVMFILSPLSGVGSGTRVETETDKDGKLSLIYDPARFWPTMMAIEPANSYWTALLPPPTQGGDLPLGALPKTGPDAWWRQLVQLYGYDEDAGKGIKIGVVDTGLGPHPYLKHAKGLGAITLSGDQRTAKATQDTRGHGTHVAGLIGARPVKGSGDYAGIAPGADLGAVRVFDAEGGAHQGDIAEAIDALSIDFEADLINLSLGASEPSMIERDAVVAALENGALCVASAGNDRGAPLSFPAGYPETIAVSALGLYGAAPEGTMASASVPQSPYAFASAAPGLFAANFSNVGPGLTCSAPGVGIISTVPATGAVPAPYGIKNGTSMAAPIATAALATVLAQDPVYRDAPRGPDRATRATQVLFAMLRNIGLSQPVGGYGLATGLNRPPEPPVNGT